MKLQGRVWKDPNSLHWLIEVSFLHIMTQGKTRKETLGMLEDAIIELFEDTYESLLHEKLQLTIDLQEYGTISIGSTHDTLLLALALKRQQLFSNSIFE